MAIYLRGDATPVRAIRQAAPCLPHEVEVWMSDDNIADAPLIVHRARLVADGGASEIDVALAVAS